MEVRPLSISGAWEFVSREFLDPRGSFKEMYKSGELAKLIGAPMHLAQVNISRSRAGVVRGIHYADNPPGQAKYVMCIRGEIRDVVVDLRRSSQTYGRWEPIHLTESNHRAVYISEGLGHGFTALTDATVLYLTSSPYDPKHEHAVNPLDPDLVINWGITEPLLSEKDQAAPSLAMSYATGRLPR